MHNLNLLFLALLFFSCRNHFSYASTDLYCNIHVVIDEPLFLYWRKSPENVTSSVDEVIRGVNIIYKNHKFGVQFQVSKITTGRRICSVNDCPDIGSLLNKFSEFANSSEHCLHYLFSYRLV